MVAPNFDPRKAKKTSMFLWLIKVFEKLAFEFDIDFWSDVGANLAAFLFSKSIKIPPKIDPKTRPKIDRIWDRFLMDFGSIFGTKLGPCWRQFQSKTTQDGPKSHPRAVQEGVQEASRRHLGPNSRPRRTQQPPKTHPDGLQAWIWELFFAGDFG